MKPFDIDNRVKLAVSNFESGYNCAQSLFLAYSDLFNLDNETARNISVSFGGGLGRMREVCGVMSGMALLAGFRYPVNDPSDHNERTKNYEMVQRMASLFKEKYKTIICRELLESISIANVGSPVPEQRTSEYYSIRPCVKFVAEGAYIAGKMLMGEFD